MATINIKEIARKGMVSKTAMRASRDKAFAVFQAEEEKLYEDVVNHEVSRELLTDRSPGKYTLFGFLGFEADRNPVKELIDYLKTAVIFNETPIINTKGKEAIISYKVTIPTKNETYDGVPKLKWGFSWLYGIENFIPGIERFLFLRKPPGGRSHLGYQAKEDTKSGLKSLYRKQNYITGILKSFVARLQPRQGGRFSK